MRTVRTLDSMNAKPARTFSRLKLYAAVLAASQWTMTVQASPEGGQVVGGEGVIEQAGVETIITQATERMAIDWRSFDVAANERVEFIQPSSSAVALNRVIGNRGSEILGRIDANGQVMLVNGNGIVFGKDSVINVGGMIASGLNINPDSFINGDFALNSIEGAEGKVINYGIINAATGGSVTLVGEQVQNDGLISAKLGAVNLVAGNAAVLTFDPSGMVGVKVTEAVMQDELGVDAAVINNGTINAQGGRVLLSASVSEDVFSNAVNNGGMNKNSSVVMHDDGSFTLGAGSDVINTGDISVSTTEGDAGQVVALGNNITHSGSITADTAKGVGGSIEIHSTDKTLLTDNSTVSAQATTQGEGGDVKVLGNKVGLFDNAEVNSSGANGGGQVLIGGDKTGANKKIRNADFIYLGEKSAVKTDASVNGDGGQLITFASDTAQIYGNLYSRGGIEGGDGGFIETSGLKGFDILNTPDMRASAGAGGTWLVDPYNITITGIDKDDDTYGDSSPFESTSNSNLSAEAILDALKIGNVTVQTGGGSTGPGDITLSTDLRFNFNADATLRLLAHNNINLNNNIQRANDNVTGTLNLELIANKDNLGNDAANGGGSINIQSGLTISTNGGYFYAGKSAQEDANGRLGNDYTNKVFNFISNGTISTYGALGGGDIVINATNNVSLGGLAFNYDSGQANSYNNNNTKNLVRVGSVSVISGGNVTLNSEIRFNNTGSRQGGGESGTSSTFSGNRDTFLNIDADGDITINGVIHDFEYGDARDALNIKLIADKNNDSVGTVSINADIYTAGGNFEASGENFNSSKFIINTDRANDDATNGAGGSKHGDAQWSNGGNVTIKARTEINLGAVVTDKSCINVCTGNLSVGGIDADPIDGDQFIVKVEQDSSTITRKGVPLSQSLKIAGTTTFNTGSGSVTLNNATNEFSKGIAFTSAGAVSLRNTLATELGYLGENNVATVSHITGDFTLTSGGNISQEGAITVDGISTFDLNGSAATDKNIDLSNSANDFKDLVTVTNAADVSLRDGNNLSLASLTTSGNIDLQAGSGDGHKIILNGDLSIAAGAASDKSITLRSNVDLANDIKIDAGAGAITFNGTTNSNSAVGKNLNLIGAAIKFDRDVGGLHKLGDFKIASTGNVGFVDISAKSVDVSASGTFTAQNITTAGNTSTLAEGEAGGIISIKAGSLELNNVNSSGGDSTAVGDFDGGSAGNIALTANGATDAKTITIHGDIKANGGKASGLGASGSEGTVQLTLENTDLAGQVNLNSDTFLSSTISVTGSGDDDTLSLTNTANNWTLSAENKGQVMEAKMGASRTISFTGFENITGGSGADNFKISHNITSSINGGAGNDTFEIATASLGAAINGGEGDDTFLIKGVTSITNVIDGGGGTEDKFDVAEVTEANVVTFSDTYKPGSFVLQNFEAVHGNNSTTLELTSGNNTWDIKGKNAGEVSVIEFEGISKIVGDAQSDSLKTSIGSDVIWSIKGENAGVIAPISDSESPLISFSNIGNLVGSDEYSDTFAFETNSKVVSAKGGEGGNDTADLSALGEQIITVGGLTGFAFSEVERLKGNQNLTLRSASAAVWTINSDDEKDGEVQENNSISSMAFIDFGTLQGSDGADTFNLLTSFGGIINAGSGNDKFEVRSAYTGRLEGGEGADTFAFFGNGSIAASGFADGGTGSAIDIVDLSGLSEGSTIGVSSSTVYGVQNIERVIADVDKNFTLAAIGNAGNNWTIEAVNGIDGKFDELEFKGFKTLEGGSGSDVFNIKTNFEGVIRGNGGTDTFNVDTEFSGLLDGGAAGDTFTINRVFSGTLIGGDGNDTININALITGNISGGSGSDTFIFTNAGSVSPAQGKTADGGTGTDVVDLSGINADRSIALNASAISGLTGIERVIGNASRNFTLDASATTTALDWFIDDIDGTGPLDGVNDGKVATIEFVNFKTLIGGSGADSFTFNKDFTGTVRGAGGDDSFTFNANFSGTAEGASGNDIFFINSQITGSLQGGDDADRFVFSANGRIASNGSANAGGGADSVDLSTIAEDTAVELTGGNTLYGVFGVERIIGNDAHTFTLSTTRFNTDWEIYDFDGDETLSDGKNDGKVAGIEFVDFKRLQGGGGTDTFNLLADYAGVIDGAGGDDIFNIRTTITGTLLGGSGRDTYVFFADGKIAAGGESDAGSDGSRDRADFSNLADGSVILLSDEKIGNIAGIEQILGSDSKNFTLAAASGTNTWRITNSYSGAAIDDGQNDGVLNTIQFINFKNLLGGSGADTFIFEGTTNSIGSIDGGLGINTLRGRDMLNTWIVSPADAGTISVGDSQYVAFSRIQDLVGGDLSDLFYINGSIRDVMGGAGNDGFIFSSLGNVGTARTVIGGAGDDELIGRQTDNTWVTADVDAGTVGVTGGQAYVTNFSSIERWVGGEGADVFTLNHRITNGIRAADGNNRFNVNTRVGDLEGGAGNDQFVFGEDGSARSVNGGGGTENTLTARDTNNIWTITATNAGKIASGSGDYLENFLNIQILNGGAGSDTFNINASVDRIFGHAGNDTFSFSGNNNASTALLDGGVGSDTLNMLGVTRSVTVATDAQALADVKVIDIESILANTSFSNTLIGDSINNKWHVDAENKGFIAKTVNATSGKINFSGFANLVGSDADDIVTFLGSSANVTGHIDMRGGQDLLDLKASDRDLILRINSARGLVPQGQISVSNVEIIDSVASRSNRIIADNYINTWIIDGINAGRVTSSEAGTVIFTGFKNLGGGNKDDRFAFEALGKVDGLVDGGAHENFDIIDLSKSNNSNVVIASTGDSLGFINIEKYIGNNTTSTFTGANILNDWVLSGTNSGVLNKTIQFENFGELKGGSAQDNFKIENATISGSIDAGDGNDTFDIRASAIAGKIKAGNGDDRFIFTIIPGAEGIATIEGGEGDNRLTVEGGEAAYKAVHQVGGLEYASANNNISTISYTGFANIFDNVLADNLSIFGTSAPDIFRLQTSRYDVNSGATINYTNKSNLTVNGAVDDKAIVDGVVSVDTSVRFNNLQVLAENAGKIQTRSLEFINTGDVGSSSNRLGTVVTDLSLTATNGKIFLDEQDNLQLKNFNVSTTDLIDLKVGSNLSLVGALSYTGTFNVESLRGNIDFGASNALSGTLNLRASGNVSLGNAQSLLLGDVFAQNANISSGGSIKGNGVFSVAGLTSVAAATDISLLNAANDFNQITMSGDRAEIFDRNGFTSTGLSLATSANLRSAGNINVGSSCTTDCATVYGINTKQLTIETDAGVTFAKNVLASESVDVKAQAITLNDSITTNQILLNGGGGKILLNDGGNILAQNGGRVSLQANSIEQFSTIVSDGDIELTTSADIGMSERAAIESLNGNVSMRGRDIQLASVKAVNGLVEMNSQGGITDANGAAINVTADRWSADAINGIGTGFGRAGDADAIETDVKHLSLRNAGKLQPTTPASSINLVNANSVTIEQLRNNGDIAISTLTGEIVLDNTNNEIYDPTSTDARTQGGVINTNVGMLNRLQLNSANGMVRATNKANKKNPDIISDIATFTLNEGYDFGERNRRIVMHIPETYAQIARFSFVAWYLNKPKSVTDLSQVPPDSLISGSDQLIQIEALNEIDPAVFTGLRNYLHDEVAILLPLDQRFDDEDDAL